MDAWKDALAGDPISAFGGILITNQEIDYETAQEINKLFCELVIAPKYDEQALEILKSKKNRIILIQKNTELPKTQFKSVLNGTLFQDRDLKMETPDDLQVVTEVSPPNSRIEDLLFANKIVKHSKSNTIVLAKNKQLVASGIGQTSRIDSLKQAIVKAKQFKFDLNDSVMASDAFFPFSDSVEIAHSENIMHIIQPGGSIRDKDSVEFCNKNKMTMVFTGTRHFRH
jgi:phosphoribosylaminoimidazolecarboxamide formyltransferase/IMP cyclohydrolase